jgi:hypothetical protein
MTQLSQPVGQDPLRYLTGERDRRVGKQPMPCDEPRLPNTRIRTSAHASRVSTTAVFR